MKQKLYSVLILLPFVWLFSGLLCLHNGDKALIPILIASIIATLVFYGVDSIKKNIKDKGLWLVIAMTGYAVFSYYYHGLSSREMRALLGSTLFLLVFPRELLTTNVLRWLTVLGALSLLAFTYYINEYLHLSRLDWPIHYIPHGTMGASIAALALVLFMYADNNTDRVITVLSWLMAISAVVVNQSRGIWLAFIVTTIILLFLKVKAKGINWCYVLIAMIGLVVAGYVAMPKFQQRLNDTQIEISSIESDNLNTSIGLRLQMWIIAPKLIKEHPLLGSGDGHSAILKTLSEQGQMSKSLMRFNPTHYHNQYLDRWIKGGIVALLLLLSILIYPLMVGTSVIAKQAIIGMVSTYAVAGLTDVPLNHGAPLFMFLLLMLTLTNMGDKANA